MAAITWPVALDRHIKQSVMEKTYQRRTTRTPMEVGPDKVRAIDDAGSKYLSCQYDLDKDEVAVLESFYLDDAKQDAIPFDWTDPITGSSIEYRFMPDSFSIVHIAGDRWLATFALEELP